jgi:bacterioferritin-associated ferredoxin
MYVCLCHAVTDRRIRQAVQEEGASGLRQIQLCLRVGTQCGKCIPAAREIVHAEIGRQQVPAQTPDSPRLRLVSSR